MVSSTKGSSQSVCKRISVVTFSSAVSVQCLMETRLKFIKDVVSVDLLEKLLGDTFSQNFSDNSLYMGLSFVKTVLSRKGFLRRGH